MHHKENEPTQEISINGKTFWIPEKYVKTCDVVLHAPYYIISNNEKAYFAFLIGLRFANKETVMMMLNFDNETFDKFLTSAICEGFLEVNDCEEYIFKHEIPTMEQWKYTLPENLKCRYGEIIDKTLYEDGFFNI